MDAVDDVPVSKKNKKKDKNKKKIAHMQGAEGKRGKGGGGGSPYWPKVKSRAPCLAVAMAVGAAVARGRQGSIARGERARHWRCEEAGANSIDSWIDPKGVELVPSGRYGGKGG